MARWLCPSVLLLLACPALAAAAEDSALTVEIPPVLVAPFAVMLLAIALLPLVAGHWWHSNVHKGLVALLLAGPVVGYLLALEWHARQPGFALLGHALVEYVEFIVLLGALYTVAGGIVLQGRFHPNPWQNTLFLAAGAVLANFIGTTGASMLLVRPLLRVNHAREHHHHLPIFFVFVVSNLGGLLTPLGDPPLFLGFLRGVDFFFTFSLWATWLVANGAVLLVFFAWDFLCYRREKHPVRGEEHPSAIGLRGVVNVALLLGIVLAVLLKSEAVGGFLVDLGPPWPQVLPTALMVLMALLSLALTPQGVRHHNGFTWDAIVEVAVLFLGIFLTMIPALALLDRRGAELGLTEPWHYFWATGGLSSFLDNAPTYLTFATVAAHGRSLHELMVQEPHVLQAISAGAVFLGAMTYIGNGPNFMVKSIAEGMGYRMPSFFGYLAYSCVVLLPVFVLVTYLFFLD
jgi:Na+/H+ antiporter NhaD/arsenite permease-like protein